MEKRQGIYWEKGALQGCQIIFQDENSHLCIGSEDADGPTLLIRNDSYMYLYITSAHNGCPNDYFVIEDFDGPFKLRHSGYIYESGNQRIQLL